MAASRAPFIWISEQRSDPQAQFRRLVREGATRRDDGLNRWYLFRRRFDLHHEARQASADITVDGRFNLYINGHYVTRGPARSAPTFQRYDRVDITPWLRPGANVLALLVHVYGCDMAWYETARDPWQTALGDGVVYCQARIDMGEHTLHLQSDTQWRWQTAQAWQRDTPRSGWGQDFIEVHDARLMPTDWADVDYDDGHWPACAIKATEPTANDQSMGWNALQPFPTLLPSELPTLLETPRQPVRVLAAYGVPTQAVLTLDRQLFDEILTPLPDGLLDNAEALLNDDDSSTTVRTLPGCDVALLLAFDERHAGFPFIELMAHGDEIIDVAVAETIPGEYAATAPAQPRLGRATFLDGAHQFRYIARPGIQQFRKFEWTAVKYLQLVVRNAPKGLRIRHVGSVHYHYPVQWQGWFECSDPLLNRLWRVGANTALECTHDAFEDCPSREKRQWLGDAHVHYLIHAAAFGSSTAAIDRQVLIQATESQRSDGLMQMFAPGDHHTQGIIIPDFNLHWVLAVHNHQLHTGDLATVAQVWPTMQRMLAWFERQQGPHGLLVDVPHWHFIEWADVGRSGEAAIINALWIGALRSAIALAQALDDHRVAALYRQRISTLVDAFNQRLWNKARGVYVDSVDPVSGQQSQRVSQHANAAAILWDIAPPSRWSGMIDTITDPARVKLTSAPPVVVTTTPFDPAHDVVQANTYFGHFLYAALGRVGRFGVALNAIRQHFGPMLATGTETLWESFEPSASLCHAFSGGAVHHLSRQVLGVTPTQAGFARFRLAPQLADLDHAQGRYPTPHGAIGVHWQRSAEGLILEVDVPGGCQTDVVAPQGYTLERQPSVLGPGTHRLNLAHVP